jgi:hypothetical protein
VTCDKHPGVTWNGGPGFVWVDGHLVPGDPTPCFVCHPTMEQEGKTEHTPPAETGTKYQPASRLCIVLPDPASDKPCGKPYGGHTVLGYSLCDECLEAVRR